MTITVGDFKQDKYAQIALKIREAILDHAARNHLTLVEAIGILEAVKFEMYEEQVEGEREPE